MVHLISEEVNKTLRVIQINDFLKARAVFSKVEPSFFLHRGRWVRGL